MRREIWLTNRVYGTWVPAPSINYSGGPRRWGHQMNYLDGGASVRSSVGSHREFNLSWNLGTQEELMPISDFASGIYGDSLVYWSDPFAQQYNIVSKDWATPQIGGSDGVILTGTVRPSLVDNTTTSMQAYALPAKSAVYSNVVTANSKQLWIPIPPGYKLAIQAYGQASGNASWRVKPDNAVESILPWSTNPGAGAITEFSGTTGVSLYLGGSGTNSASILGVQAVIVPIENTVLPFTRFHSGTGHSGLAFAESPTVSYYSAVMDRIGVSANLVEVGAWQ